jgi:hypothetical protein
MTNNLSAGSIKDFLEQLMFDNRIKTQKEMAENLGYSSSNFIHLTSSKRTNKEFLYKIKTVYKLTDQEYEELIQMANANGGLCGTSITNKNAICKLMKERLKRDVFLPDDKEKVLKALAILQQND